MMATDLENTIEYYKDLLLYQFINLPNARSTIGLLVSQALIDLLPLEVNNAFDLENAVGNQLDILGEYVGFDRSVIIPIVRTYFAFNDQTNIETNLTGLTDYDSTLNSTTYFYSYNNYLGSQSTLNDDEYRILAKLKSYANRSNNTAKEINDALYEIFGFNIIVLDQLDMSIIYMCAPEYSRLIQIALDENFLPKAMGVKIKHIFELYNPYALFSFNPGGSMFGFSDYSSPTGSTGYFLSYEDKV